jgi:hypothetical protein
MPNHVTNRLCITGPQKDRDAFQATFKLPGYHEDHVKGEFSFHQTVPMPSDVFRGNLGWKEEVNYPGVKNWYGWSMENWGTKWANYNTKKPEINPKSIKIQFDTAWSPPTKWLEAVSKMFPTLKFCDKWKDEGGPKGTITLRNGKSA